MKPGVFTQLYIQLIFSPKNREALLRKEFQEQLWPYLAKTVSNLESKAIVVNGMADHVHILLGLNPKMAISDLVRDLKRSSSVWINQQKWLPGSLHGRMVMVHLAMAGPSSMMFISTFLIRKNIIKNEISRKNIQRC